MQLYPNENMIARGSKKAVSKGVGYGTRLIAIQLKTSKL
jgi:hypothetical protein